MIATKVWREKKMRGETGHILRHTYRTMAEALGIPQSRARALLDHNSPLTKSALDTRGLV